LSYPAPMSPDVLVSRTKVGGPRYLGERGRAPQDVDVLVIGEPDRDERDAALARVEQRLAVPVRAFDQPACATPDNSVVDDWAPTRDALASSVGATVTSSRTAPPTHSACARHLTSGFHGWKRPLGLFFQIHAWRA
jgi:hypothetical protein